MDGGVARLLRAPGRPASSLPRWLAAVSASSAGGGGCLEWSVARWGWPGSPPGPHVCLPRAGGWPQVGSGCVGSGLEDLSLPLWGGLENLH